MNAVARPCPEPTRVALLGTGTVGSAFRALVAARVAAGAPLSLVAEANTRACVLHAGVEPGAAGEEPAVRAVQALGHSGTRIVVDATASEAIAARHAAWLRDGLHVVTASKLGQGAGLARWQAIAAARARSGCTYGDSATVGAGLPLLRSLRALRGGGDRIHAIAGVLSGSLAWLLDDAHGDMAFADRVREAAARGYTEPDPRADLSGADVRRKLLILARAAGHALEEHAVDVHPLEPAAMDARLRVARKRGCRLAYVARFARRDDGSFEARAGLEALPPGDPLAHGGGTDNRVAIWCDRYREQPLVLQGPGAGAGVTAAALLDDLLRVAGPPAFTT